jgi:hypothetical protein
MFKTTPPDKPRHFERFDGRGGKVTVPAKNPNEIDLTLLLGVDRNFSASGSEFL